MTEDGRMDTGIAMHTLSGEMRHLLGNVAGCLRKHGISAAEIGRIEEARDEIRLSYNLGRKRFMRKPAICFSVSATFKAGTEPVDPKDMFQGFHLQGPVAITVPERLYSDEEFQKAVENWRHRTALGNPAVEYTRTAGAAGAWELKEAFR